jgi:uncharacterized protein YlxW (UPF0749 family)
MKKEQNLMAVTIGIICVVLTAFIFVQLNTIEKTNISEVESLREEDLKREIANIKARDEETLARIEETNNKIAEYEEIKGAGREASELLEQELNRLNNILKKNDVIGEGIIITLADGIDSRIDYNDLIELLNLLRGAGAEAISINDIRVILSTYIVDINHRYIRMSGANIDSPYVVKAIGDPSYLESAISQKNGYSDQIKQDGKEISIEREVDIHVPKHNREFRFEYIEN